MSITSLNYIIIIGLGLIIGSFLNVIILRFSDLKSVLLTRSHCTKCKKNLNWFDLIPVLSYMILFGKCRYCKANISLQYPLVEVGTAVLFAAIFWKFGFSLYSLFLMLASCLFIVMFVYDILKYEISDWLVIIAAGLWIIYLLVSYFILDASYLILLSSLYGGLALGGFLGLLVFVSKEKWMGAGDIGLGFILGAIAGWPNVLVSAFAAFVLGGLVGLILIALKKKELQGKLPFAPFLILGLSIALFWGEKILDWYVGGLFK